MADWKRIDALKEKRREILEDPSMGREFRNKCLLCIDTQIRAELEREGVMGELIKIVFNNDNGPIAACPNCGEQKWFINLDAYDDNWEAINGTECVNCGYSIDWIAAERD